MASVVTDSTVISTTARTKEMTKVILGASVGTAFEWYDFFVYGALAPVLGALFFSPSLGPTGAFLASLATFGVGLVARPFGSLFFGRLGDMVGRKYTFLLTMIVMGVCTVGVGLLPTYQQVGALAPFLLVMLRLVQGLALGGEYGGAATYVAEHASASRRGAATGWIQLTATAGFVLSLIAVTSMQALLDKEAFAAWGWRVPFLLSALLLVLSLYVRLQLQESPLFKEMKAQGQLSKAPIKEAFATWGNLKYVLLALFGTVSGVTVIWYAGQFYALVFLLKSMKMDSALAYWLVSIALVLAAPFFVVFGALSDRVGRKPVIIVSFLVGACAVVPLFGAIAHYANPDLERAAADAPVVIRSSDCEIRFLGQAANDCERAREQLNTAGVPFTVTQARESGVEIAVGASVLRTYAKDDLARLLARAGYPAKADAAKVDKPMVVLLVFLLALIGCAAYGANGAYLVELFPARLRYSSMSMAYHLGTGYFGGFAPYFITLIATTTGSLYAGLYYPVVIAAISIVVCGLFIPETRGWRLNR